MAAVTKTRHFTNRKTGWRVRVTGCNVVVDAIVCDQIVAVVVECGGTGVMAVVSV